MVVFVRSSLSLYLIALWLCRRARWSDDRRILADGHRLRSEPIVRIHRPEHPELTDHVMGTRGHRTERSPPQHVLRGRDMGPDQVGEIRVPGRKLEHLDLAAAGQPLTQPGRELLARKFLARADLRGVPTHAPS